MPDESQIIIECQSGKLERFGLLYDSYFKKIYNFIFYRTLCKEIAEDLTSQTFFKALQGINSFNSQKGPARTERFSARSGGQFSSWLYRIAKNNVVDYYRSRRNEIDIEDVWDLKDDGDLRASIENKERVAKINEYLKLLKPEHRQIVIMRVWDEMSYSEIAQILGKSEDNCKVMFSRVIGKIREEKGLVWLLTVLFILLRFT